MALTLSVVLRESQTKGSMIAAWLWLIFIPEEENLSSQVELPKVRQAKCKNYCSSQTVFFFFLSSPSSFFPSSWATAAKTSNPGINTEWFSTHLQAVTWSLPSEGFLTSNWITHGAAPGTVQKQWPLQQHWALIFMLPAGRYGWRRKKKEGERNGRREGRQSTGSNSGHQNSCSSGISEYDLIWGKNNSYVIN